MPWPKPKTIQTSLLWRSMSCMRCSTNTTQERSPKRARVDRSQEAEAEAAATAAVGAAMALAADSGPGSGAVQAPPSAGSPPPPTACPRPAPAPRPSPPERSSPEQRLLQRSPAVEELEEESRHLPDVALYHIFSYLAAADLCRAKRVCSLWCEMAEQDSLWKALVRRKWKLGPDATLPAMSGSWQEEYRRLWFCVPSQLAETIQEHRDEVLHVSFSHDGRHFSTTSRDCSVKVWRLGQPTRLLHSYDLQLQPSWEYTHSSYFNSSDSLLMVHILSHSPRPQAYVAVLAVGPERLALAALLLVDVAAWASDTTFLGATWELVNNSLVLQVKSFEVRVSEERLGLIGEMARKNLRKLEDLQDVRSQLLFTLPRSFDVMGNMIIVPQPPDSGPAQPGASSAARLPGASHSHTGRQQQQQQQQQQQEEAGGGGRPGEQDREQQLAGLLGGGRRLVALGSQLRNTLHLLSLQQQQPASSSPESAGGSGKGEGGAGPQQPAGLGGGLVSQVLGVEGRICGMCYSPDRRFLFINCRPWLQPPSPLQPLPDLAPGLQVRAIDLATFRETSVRYSGHHGYHPSMFCTIEPDASADLVASGSTNSLGFVWDRHHGCLVARLSHALGVFNTVAFHPHQQECCVSVGDDHCIKVWLSRRLQGRVARRPAQASQLMCGLLQ